MLELWLGIAARDIDAADRMLGRIEGRLEILSSWPMAGAAWPSIDPDARLLVERPYLILYRLTAAGPQIVRVLHGARNIDRAMFRDGLDG